MSEPLPIFLRAHTEVLKPRKKKSKSILGLKGDSAKRNTFAEPKWPECVLVLDYETTTDERQSLTFGSYRFCREVASGVYECVYEGIFYADDLPETTPKAISILQKYVDTTRAETPDGYPSGIELLSRSDFVERVFWRSINAGAAVVGFNLPFDLSRLAVECSPARRRNQGWSLVLSQDKDPETGLVRHNPFRSRIVITPKDSKAAFIRLAGSGIRKKKTGKRLIPYRRGRFLDLRTLGWALRNQSFGLDKACEAFHVPGKSDHEPTGQVSVAEIRYCRQDVRATVGLLNAMRAEFDRHPLDLMPDSAFSPASIAKAYLKKMGVIPPAQKFALPRWVLAVAMQAYYGGRAECHIRQTAVPVVHTDFLSEYPTVNTLMGLWRILIAKDLRIEDATDAVRGMLSTVTPEAVFNPDFWKELSFFVLVRPCDEVLAVRTVYNGKNSNIGINPLKSAKPVWVAGPDAVGSTLLSGRPPEIIRAFRVVPEGRQDGLKKVALRGMIEIDPATDDLFKAYVEARSRVKSDKDLPESERKALSYFLKILANSGS